MQLTKQNLHNNLLQKGFGAPAANRLSFAINFDLQTPQDVDDLIKALQPFGTPNDIEDDDQYTLGPGDGIFTDLIPR